jgi:hypothetical protein
MDLPANLWVGSIVIEVQDLPSMMRFWKAALAYEPREPPSADWVVLCDPRNRGPNRSLARAEGESSGGSRHHLDLYSPDPTAEVTRLVRLGARLMEPAEEGRDFVTLADPDGNPFDVIDKRGFAFGQLRP